MIISNSQYFCIIMKIDSSTLLELVSSFIFIIDKQNENDDTIDDPYIDACENLKIDIGQQTTMNDHARPEKKTSEGINLEDTEVVTTTENIYYYI